MKAYSPDLRERVLRAVDQGEPRSQIVRMVAISLATIKPYLKQRPEMGQVRPKAIPGRPARKGAALQTGLLAQLQAHPRCQLRKALSALGKRARHARQYLDEESHDPACGLDTKKKSLPASERHEEERASFREQLKGCEARAVGRGG